MKLFLSSLKHKLSRNTSFPELDEAHVPELARLSEEDETSDEESVARRRQKYRTKEDEDVAVFMDISKRLSTQSLIFLLQNHVRHMQGIPEQELNAALARQQRAESLRGSDKSPSAISKRRQFRFAELSHQQVRAVVHEIPRNDALDEDEDDEDQIERGRWNWWTPEEYSQTRFEAAQEARYYRKHMPGLVHSISVLADPGASARDVERSLQSLMHSGFGTRGLESHMARCLSAPRKETVQAVLEAQRQDKMSSYEEASERLRRASLERSAPNRSFAQRMGAYDQMEGLKAVMSRWRSVTTTAVTPPTTAAATSEPSLRSAMRACAVRKLSRESSLENNGGPS